MVGSAVGDMAVCAAPERSLWVVAAGLAAGLECAAERFGPSRLSASDVVSCGPLSVISRPVARLRWPRLASGRCSGVSRSGQRATWIGGLAVLDEVHQPAGPRRL